MTITNHIRYIEEFTPLVIKWVDARKYREAHNVLNRIESKCRLAHEHIDMLQSKTDCAARPAGGD